MGNAAEIVDSDALSPGAQPDSKAQVQAALLEIFRSPHFHASKQSQHLLQYIVDKSLTQQVEHLKERVIGAEVFGRSADYDTNADPIVRARVAEVRKRLAQYYLGEGSLSPVRIEINLGSYVATFSGPSQTQLDAAKSHSKESHVHEIEAVQTQSPVHVPQPQPLDPASNPAAAGARTSHFRTWLLPGITVFAVLAVGLAYLFRPASAVEQFWSLMLDRPKPVLIYTGAFPVYMPSPELTQRYLATHHVSDLDAEGYQFLVPVTKDQKFGPDDLIESKNDFVTLGDVSANASVVSLLTHFNRTFDLRSGEDVAFGDLRQSPAILIGAFNNQMTLQMTGELPFIFGSGLTIRDRSNATQQWHPVNTSPTKVVVDYALVTRLPSSKTGGPLITIAGITRYGTRAAAEFITSETRVSELLKAAPKGWASKNMELLLQTKVVNDIPTEASVVAVRYW